MKRAFFLFLFFFIFVQQINASVEGDALPLDEVMIVQDDSEVAKTIDLNENQISNEEAEVEEEDDENFMTLTDVLVNAYGSFRHFLREGVDAIVIPISSGKKYLIRTVKNELGQEKYYARLAPSTVVFGAKNIQMLFSFLTHIALKNEYKDIKKLKLGGYSVPFQELYEQLYQLQTSDVLSYEHKAVADKISKLVPEVAVIALWHAMTKGFLVGQEFGSSKNKKFKVEDNMNLLLQGQLANTLDGSVDEFLSLEIDQIVFGITKALLRGATVFARNDVKDAGFELNNDNLKQAGAEALLPIIIDGCVNKVPLGLTKVNKKRLECAMHWISKTILRQILFPQD